jgi:hypothetical protein
LREMPPGTAERAGISAGIKEFYRAQMNGKKWTYDPEQAQRRRIEWDATENGSTPMRIQKKQTKGVDYANRFCQ